MRTDTWRAATILVVLALFLPSCGDDSPSAPTQPQPAPQPTSFDIAVQVQTPRGNPVAFASLEIIDGYGVGQTFTADEDGEITLTGVEGRTRILATSDKCSNDRQWVEPPTSGTTRIVTFTIQTNNPWSRSGKGPRVFDMPRCVDRVEIRGVYGGSCEEFVVWIDGVWKVNVILGTCPAAIAQISYTGWYSCTGGEVKVEHSRGIQWTITQLRP